MACFFDELDAIYCSCLPERKPFVLDQFEKLGILEKTKIFDACTPDHEIVTDVVKKHLIFPVYFNNLSLIAQHLSCQKITEDIVENKYNYALVLEDDVYFLPESIDVGNKWITRDLIDKHFNTNKPYTLFLQTSLAQSFYSKKGEGIFKGYVRYGEPAYIMNHLTAACFQKNKYPITAPYDEYTNAMRKRYRIQEGVLIPYICRELSANFFKCNIDNVGFKFERSLKKRENARLFTLLKQSRCFLTTDTDSQNLLGKLMRKINPGTDFVFDEPQAEDQMIYNISYYATNLDSYYVIGCTIDENINCSGKPKFIISVRGKKSAEIIHRKYKFRPMIGDPLLCVGKFFPIERNLKYDYCFVYPRRKINIICSKSHIEYTDDESLFEIIASSKYTISDNINYISIANSYSNFGVFASLGEDIDEIKLNMANDYYSNITKSKICPIVFSIEEIIIDDEISEKIEKFIQPSLPLSEKTIMKYINMFPFAFKCPIQFKRPGAFVQVF